MNTEELIKKLEELEYPEIEVTGHKDRLKTALLSSRIFRKQHIGSFLRIHNDGIEISVSRRILIPSGILILTALGLIWRAGWFHQNLSQIITPTATPISMSIESQPLLTIIEPMDDATVAANIISVQGKTEPDAVVSINDEITVADAEGNFSVDVSLDTGINMINITASDSSAAQATTTIVVNSAEGV